MYILILNGPNINFTGMRRPDIYGTAGYREMKEYIEKESPCPVIVMQHNSEGDIIDTLHRIHFDSDCIGVVLNAGAYTHYSYAIADAIEAIDKPVVEVHMSNIHAREDFRSKSVTAPYCIGVIAGFGVDSYLLGVRALMRHVAKD